MAILPAQTIRKLSEEQGLIEPFTERGVFNGKTYGLGPCTYDFRCKQKLTILSWWQAPAYLACRAIDTALAMLKKPERFEHVKLCFTLASSIERVKLPDDIGACVMDKSSWARKGLSVFNTHFDPGFEGYATLELTNNSLKALVIPEGMAICQFKFERLEAPTEMPYRGKYQNQDNRPVEAREGVTTWS